VKRRELMRRLASLAREHGVELEVIEGGSHSKVTIGPARTTVPRHAEVNELTARGILRHVEKELDAATPDGESDTD